MQEQSPVEYAFISGMYSAHACSLFLSLSLSLSPSPLLSLSLTRAQNRNREWRGNTRSVAIQVKRSHNTREPQKIAARAETEHGENYELLRLPFAGQKQQGSKDKPSLSWKFTIVCANVFYLAMCAPHSHLYIFPPCVFSYTLSIHVSLSLSLFASMYFSHPFV